MTHTDKMLREGSLAGKVVVVTGGGSGLGKAMTSYFLELGAKVAITSRKLEKLEATAQELSDKTGGECFAVACDVRDYEQVEHMHKQVLDHFGPIDVLLNNAAGNFISPTENLSSNAFDTVVDIVLTGTKNCTMAFAFTGSGYVVPSATAKGGVLAMTRSLAVEWSKYGMRFNAIAPGPFPTKGAWDRLLPGPLVKKFDPAKKVPIGRVGDHQELANLAAYVISDFGAYLNGEVIVLDGGEWLKGAGQFNMLDKIPKALWTVLRKAMLKKK